jgi:multidrug efflux system outer membrane protein
MRATRFAVLLVTTITTLAGCASSSSTKHRDVPDLIGTTKLAATPATASTRPGLSIARWWITYDDENLDRLVAEALAHNDDLDAALARVREAQAVVDQARTASLPTLDAQWRTSRAQQSAVGATPIPSGLDRRATTHRASLDTSYEVDLWGKLSSTTAAARYQLLASEWKRWVVRMFSRKPVVISPPPLAGEGRVGAG